MTHRRRENESFTISVVAEMFQLTPQTLRLYETHGLLQPSRSEGGTRTYTREDLKRLATICHLVNDMGVNLAGVEVVLRMMDRYNEQEAALVGRFRQIIEHLQDQISDMQSRGGFGASLVPLPRFHHRPDTSSDTTEEEIA